MKKIFIFIIGLIITGTLFYGNKIGFSCTGIEKLEKNVDGTSMDPMIKHGDKVDLLVDYYNICDKEVNLGDLVAYNYGGNKLALINVVKVNDDQIVSFSGGNIIVDGSALSNSIGEKYIFNEKEINMLGMYVIKGKIPENSFFIFGDNVTNSIDSRKFGAVSEEDFLGKFEIKN